MVTAARRVDPQETSRRVESAVGALVENLRVNFGHVDVYCRPADLVEVARKLRDEPECAFHFFSFLSAIDRSEFADEPGGLEVLVHLYSPEHAQHVTIHVPVAADQPVCPSLTGLFKGSDWHEREAAEMFGIDFEGHPRLVNLYLPEDFDGHPGLRSFKIPTRLVKDWPGAKDPEEAAAGGR
ncbi:MAG: NADH-quinone oxidoreductase subunit C [Actinomycetota bacterium]|nr:NADH-quinone oxidoreductase subunit C [Actinomycetota bacterium]